MEQMFLARHGETEWNRIRRRQGQLDSSLTRGALAHASLITPERRRRDERVRSSRRSRAGGEPKHEGASCLQ